MSHQRVTQGSTRTGDYLQNARGQSGRVGQFSQFQRGERRNGGWLQQHGIPSGQSRSHLPAGDGKGEIPRHDGRDDSQRLAQSEIEPSAGDRNSLTVEPADASRVIFKNPRPQSDFITGIGQWLADMQNL